jgi:hypothetical protein
MFVFGIPQCFLHVALRARHIRLLSGTVASQLSEKLWCLCAPQSPCTSLFPSAQTSNTNNVRTPRKAPPPSSITYTITLLKPSGRSLIPPPSAITVLPGNITRKRCPVFQVVERWRSLSVSNLSTSCLPSAEGVEARSHCKHTEHQPGLQPVKDPKKVTWLAHPADPQYQAEYMNRWNVSTVDRSKTI